MILCGDITAGTGERSGAGTGTPPSQCRKRAEGGEGQSGLIRVSYATNIYGA